MESAKTADIWKRLFSLFAGIMALVVADKRSAEEVADVLQVIKDKKDFSTFLGTKNKRGYALYLGWRGIAVRVDWDDPDDIDKNLCSRAVVS